MSMRIDRLRRIIEISKKHREDTNSMARRFCSFAEIDQDNDVLNIMQIVRSSFLKKGYWVFEMPFADDEIGALCYKGDGLGYVVINTSLPKVNANFAIAHEVFHVFFQNNTSLYNVEFADDHYYEHEEEYEANLFAGVLLMPEFSFRKMFAKFYADSDKNVQNTIIMLMAYYEVPYMSALIRCIELDLLSKDIDLARLLDVDREKARDILNELWLDECILDATNKDDYPHVEAIVRRFGEQYIEKNYLSEKELEDVISNIKILHSKLKGE